MIFPLKKNDRKGKSIAKSILGIFDLKNDLLTFYKPVGWLKLNIFLILEAV